MVQQGDLFRQRYLAAADQPDSGGGVVRVRQGAGRHQGRGAPGKAGDEVAKGGLERLGESHYG
jgi:hypothetical protein